MKKPLALAAAAVALAAAVGPSAAAVTPEPVEVDSSVNIFSTTPVPGAATTGRWEIANTGATTIPAGTTYRIRFTSLTGEEQRGLRTISSLNLGRATTTRLSEHEFRVTLTRDLGAGSGVAGLWNDSHGFRFSERDQVTLTLESLPAQVVDTKPSNDTATYDNGGTGF
ncbi:hypothetical protein [Falsarthrobacter nasiphocae]|uniref:Lamin tail domain-containing protein n=1 Tax=Falsarthrobacter nasiphocae TaxID=189863 RepID=A0AAE3YHS1_9MICC|nr:hypothetical protein [Falsarthrobacter nasiphocae]MDR6891991.1 hypothetical protein [Falsarthrobacter nasiphocae]